MKRLIVSIKTGAQSLEDFKSAYRKAKSRKLKEPHYEVSFDNRREFERFISNVHILSAILASKPKSVYELAKVSGMDVSNLNKIITFFEQVGVIRIKVHKIAGRSVKTPIVEYDRIEFKLVA